MRPIEEIIMEILEKHGIRMSVSGCGCCGSPRVTFEYEGKMIADDEHSLNFNMFDEKKGIG